MEKQWIFDKRIVCAELPLGRYLEIFGISASAYHKWEKRDTLEDLKPVPKNRPRTTPPEELSRALDTTLNYNRWGGQKLCAYLLLNGFFYLSPATLNRIKKYVGQVIKAKDLKLPVSYEFINAGDAWSLDFLEFIWGMHKLYILVVIDDCSRYLLNWTVTSKATTELVQELLKETFLIHGTPKVLKSDNGPQFREELASYLEKMQIEHYPSPYRQPEYNGKTERQNKELRFAVKRAALTETIEECISIIGRSFYEYNYIRPHQAIGSVTPYQRFSGFEEEIKARVQVFKERELQRKERLVQRTLWVPGYPDPQYVPQKLVLPGQPKEYPKGLIVPVKSKKHRGKTIGYVRQSLNF